MSKHSSKGYEWEALRLSVLEEAGYACVVCGGAATHVDHIIPKSRGGTDDRHNLQAMCSTHNLKKGNKTVVRGTYWNETAFPNGLPSIETK